MEQKPMVMDDALFEMLSLAYQAGARWMMYNAASPEFIAKAADDYADRMTSERRALPPVGGTDG